MRILALLLTLAACACSNDDRIPAAPDVITIGVLPDQLKTALSTQYDPLVKYLEAAVGVKIVLSIPTDYQDLLEQFDAGQLDIANFGAFTFIQAELRSGAEPLVMRDIDLQFRSCYLVKTSDRRSLLEEFRGEAFSFGPRLSTSGHIMPRYFFTQNRTAPESFFASIQYSSGHDRTAELVANGTVAIGVANCAIVQSMFDNEQISADAVRILDTTPPYADYVWATQPSLDPVLKNRLRDAFLAISSTDPAHRAILSAVGAGGYLPAGKGDFDRIRAATRAMDLDH